MVRQQESERAPGGRLLAYPIVSEIYLKTLTENAKQGRMKTVILCGGLGTRLREETEYRPKPMVEIGGRPVLWHIMKNYTHHGHRDFVLCLGYRGNDIKEVLPRL